MTLTEFVGTTATVSTIAQFLTGLFTVRRVWRMSSPGDLSPVPFVAATLGCSLWCLYGIILEDDTIIYTNAVGICLNAFYVGVFLTYSSHKVRLSRQIFFAVIVLASVFLYLKNLTNQSLTGKNELGLVCTVVSLASCASPLVALKHVIRTKSTDSLPFPLILSIFLVCFQWWMYGMLIEDLYMQITNLLGTVISFAQLSLFLIYPDRGAGKEKGKSGSMEELM